MNQIDDEEKKAVAQLLLSGNPSHVSDVPKDLLAQVKKEISMVESISLTKNYIIEGYLIKKNSKVSIQEEDNHYNNMIIGDNGQSINDDDFAKMCEPLIKDLQISPDNAIQITKDVVDYCKAEWVRYQKLPTIDKLKNYLIGRNQTFATV
jgi:hypothetical protein